MNGAGPERSPRAARLGRLLRRAAGLYSILVLAASMAAAQCVMCARTAAAQQVERARVLNTGILVLLIPPLLILGGILLLAWKRRDA